MPLPVLLTLPMQSVDFSVAVGYPQTSALCVLLPSASSILVEANLSPPPTASIS